ncbi:hypothetical protein LCGC14_1373540 [marine sediment metagenome]|uniref:Uncharacterized protein n=1 Tax=marine sediment metagenome TaxID=412755 RepID=A0A0F9KQS9_9ZZZZ
MDLDEATTAYWEVKQAYNGREPNRRGSTMSTEKALGILNDVLAVTGPHHPLAQKVIDLRTNIITGD